MAGRPTAMIAVTGTDLFLGNIRAEASRGDVLKQHQTDLARKWKTHRAKIEAAWRSFDKGQRTRCLKGMGPIIAHPLDRSSPENHKMVPDWNLRDITKPGSDYLLDMMNHRATKTVFEQYCEGVNGAPGDHAFILRLVETSGSLFSNGDRFKDCWTFFTDDYRYGVTVMMHQNHKRAQAMFEPAIKANFLIPELHGVLVILRQETILTILNSTVARILHLDSQTRAREERAKEPTKEPGQAVTDGLSKLSLQTPAAKLSLADVVARARDQKDDTEEYLGSIRETPMMLAYLVNVWLCSRPEVIPDENGRRLGSSDKYVNRAFFDSVHNAIQGAAIWKYIVRLLEMLEQSADDKAQQAIVLQELSNVAHFEYSRTQALVKRHFQTGTGRKWFRRASNGYDKAGNVRVSIKGNPENLTRSDPQLHYVLRLCQPATNASKAVDWVRKLSDLHERFPQEQEKLEGTELEALNDMSIILAFIQDLSSVASVPNLSRKKGQQFIIRWQGLQVELNEVKKQAELLNFAAPMTNSLYPELAKGALKCLDEFIIDKAGTKMGYLYQDLIEECCASLQQQIQQVNAKPEEKHETHWSQFASDSQPGERVELRRQKEKTRPAHSSAFEILAPANEPIEEPTTPSQTFKVSSSTAEVFSTLFTKSEARGSINWTAFEAAMAELGFSVIPTSGSVYTFVPPENMAVKRPLTLHRPHTSRIEGYPALIFARRLRRVYGFSEQTFEEK